MVKDETIRHIVRVCGTDLEGKKEVVWAIQKIKGIGPSFASAVINTYGIDGSAKIGRFTDEELSKLEDIIKNPKNHGIPNFVFNRKKDFETGEDLHVTSADLRLALKKDVDFLKKISAYKGIRHFYGLKLRGQRTASRGANQRGRSGRTVGVLRTATSAAAAAAAGAAQKATEKKPGTAAKGEK